MDYLFFKHLADHPTQEEELQNFADQTVPDKMDDWEQSEQHQETWESPPSYQVPVTNAAHPVTTEAPSGYDIQLLRCRGRVV